MVTIELEEGIFVKVPKKDIGFFKPVSVDCGEKNINKFCFVYLKCENLVGWTKVMISPTELKALEKYGKCFDTIEDLNKPEAKEKSVGRPKKEVTE